MTEIHPLGLAVLSILHVGLLVRVRDEPRVTVIVNLYDRWVRSLAVVLWRRSVNNQLAATPPPKLLTRNIFLFFNKQSFWSGRQCLQKAKFKLDYASFIVKGNLSGFGQKVFSIFHFPKCLEMSLTGLASNSSQLLWPHFIISCWAGVGSATNSINNPPL